MSTDSTSGTVLAGGAEVPALGLGTARMTGEECQRAVETALAIGYRHVDTAQMYDNEAAVGRALAESEVDRDDVFVVTKVHPDNAAPEDVRESTRASLERLGVQTVDLLLLHGPSDRAPLSDTIGAMNDLQHDSLQHDSLVDHVGISNFGIDGLEDAIDASATPIVTNQVEYHPYHQPTELVSYCIENEILVTAYSPLAEGEVVGDERLAAIGEPYGKSAAQVALRWLVQHPYVAAIPKAASREHIEADADVFDFELSPEEMRAVFELDGGVSERLAAQLALE